MRCAGGDMDGYKGCEAKRPAGPGEGGLTGREAGAWLTQGCLRRRMAGGGFSRRGNQLVLVLSY